MSLLDKWERYPDAVTWETYSDDVIRLESEVEKLTDELERAKEPPPDNVVPFGSHRTLETLTLAPGFLIDLAKTFEALSRLFSGSHVNTAHRLRDVAEAIHAAIEVTPGASSRSGKENKHLTAVAGRVTVPDHSLKENTNGRQ